MMHQSTNYFERCNGADLDPGRTRAEREGCWSAWLEHYADGQQPERVTYAEGRLAALRSGEEMAPLPDQVRYTAAYVTTSAQINRDGEESASDPGTEPDPSEPGGDSANAGSESSDVVALCTEAQCTEGCDPVVDCGLPANVRPAPPAPPPPAPRPPSLQTSQPCLRICNPEWDTCIARCTERGPACVVACEARFHVCVGGCY